MNKEEFIIMLRDVLVDFYDVYRSIGRDLGFRLFYQYVIDTARKIEKNKISQSK